MTTDERKKFIRQKRAIGWILVLLLFFFSWNNDLRNDLENEHYDNNLLIQNLQNKVVQISKLYKIIDSLKKLPPKVIIDTAKPLKKKKLDTLRPIEIKLDTTLIKTDTTSIDSIK